MKMYKAVRTEDSENQIVIFFNNLACTIKKNYSAWLLLLPSIWVLYIVMWKPIIDGLILSFYSMKGYDPVAFIGLENYINVLTDSLFLKTLINTLAYVWWSLVLGFLPPIILAIMINEIIHLKSSFKFLTYFPAIVPMVATSLVWTFLFQPGDGGILNAILINAGGVKQQWLQDSRLTIPLIVFTMTWKGCGSTAIVYLASLQGINQELYEAATLDGAGIFKRLQKITIPQIAPIVILLFVRQIIGVFQVMSEPLIMTDGGPNNASMSLNLYSYFAAFRAFQPGRALAMGTITFVILIIVTIFYFKVKDRVEDF